MDVDSLLEKIDILEYIGRYVELTEDGDDYFGVCPFHADVDPSFSVTPEVNSWYCFGCGKGGSVIKFVMKYHHLSYDDAISHLTGYVGGECIVDNSLSATKIIKKYVTKTKKVKKAVYKLLDNDYMKRYPNDTDKTKIWEDEGISRVVLDRYDVRYNPFDNRIVFPIHSLDGKLINVSGRTLDPEWKKKGLRKYTPLQEMGVQDTFYGYFQNKSEIERKNEIIIFEGAKSVMKMNTWGMFNACAALTSRLNSIQTRHLIRLGIRVVLAFDKGINPVYDKTVLLLKRYVPVEVVMDSDGLLQPKMAPVDAGKEVWEALYERRKRLN